MDELEISGKRYLSSRRAAKMHGYAADYIGQLIRADKVIGQKVGRAWYVEEASLDVYLGKDQEVQTPQRAPIPAAHTPQPVVEKIEIKKAESEPVMETRIPIHVAGVPKEKKSALVYIPDTQPLLPPLERSGQKIKFTPPVAKIYDVSDIEQRPQRRVTAHVLALLLIGVASLSLTALASTFVEVAFTVEDGQLASVEYSLH